MIAIAEDAFAPALIDRFSLNELHELKVYYR
jgi:hypothetical protein